jgi:hypothetical protein
MATKQTTAVEWLIKFLTDRGYIVAPSFGHSIIDEGIKQALAMQRNQAIKAYEAGQEDEYQYHINAVPRTDSETYYTDTYGKE